MTNKNIFSGLEELGFQNTDDLKIYNNTIPEKEEKKDQTLKSLLYNKTVVCPVCNNEFKAVAVKTSAYKAINKDSDFFIRYSLINPYFYDVWLCNKCGYAAMKSDFPKIREKEIQKILKNVTSKWHGREYPAIFDIHIAIERYKLSLLNYVVMESSSSKKAINCLKLAWMYRLIDSKDSREMENTFLKEALKGLEDAYYNENFPIYGMDKFTAMYLIGELNRRIGLYDNAMVWFSNVVTTPGVKVKLKDLARDQKDLIKEELAKESLDNESKSEAPTEEFDVNKKGGFFSKFFK